MKKPSKQSIIIGLLFFTIALLCSCGSRKTQRSKIVEETKIEVVEVAKN